MRYDLTDFEWSVSEPVLPKGRPKRKDDRRVMNGVFWVLRTGAPWRDPPERYGPYPPRFPTGEDQGRAIARRGRDPPNRCRTGPT
jgi:transposase